jgi:dolichol-phosphate mannosyltransferase
MESRITAAVEAIVETLAEHYSFYEVVIVDDSSVDASTARILPLLQRHEGLRLIRLSKPHGVDVAISAGMDSAIGDFVIVMDPVSDPPKLIPELVRSCERTGGIYYGVVKNDKVARSLLSVRHIGSWLFHWYCRRYLKLDIQRGSALLRIFDRAAVNTFIQLRDRHRPLRLMTAYLGQPLHAWPYDVVTTSRFGREDMGGFDEVNLAFDILSASSRHPLRWVSRLGFAAAVFNVFYAVYVVAIYVFKPHVAEGWATLSMQNAVMFFFLFLVLGVLSEYVGKLLVESQDRPRYTVLEERNSSVLVDASKRRNVATQSTKEELPQ